MANTAKDLVKSFLNGNASQSATGAETVVPSDTIDLKFISRGLWIGVGGNVAVVMANGSRVTFVGIAAGTLLPIRISRVDSTSTTATTMVSIY